MADNGALSKNMRLLGHNDLGGFGNCGEGMAIQLARDGRRVLWLGHESAPKNFTAVDVTDPRKPSVIVQTDLPHGRHALEQPRPSRRSPRGARTRQSRVGMQPGRRRVLRRVPIRASRARSRSSTPRARTRGASTTCGSSTAPICISRAARRTSSRATRRTTSSIGSSDVRQPTKTDRGRALVGSPARATAMPSRRSLATRSSTRVFAPHNTNVYPRRPDRAWLGYIDGGAIVLDISDMAHPRMLSRWDYHPPYPGFTHTLLPLFDPQLVIVSDEATAEAGKDWPKLVWVVDIRDETNPVPISTFPIPAVSDFGGRGGRYGAHNLHENRPVQSNLVSEKLIFGTYFNGGVRVHDVSNPFQPEEVAYYVPEAPRGSRAGAVQINDVLVDERRVVYAVDRLIGGLYTLELQV
jgi:hypothetical protein